MIEWKKYLKDRKIYKHPDDFYVIVPENLKMGQPLFCPVCSRIMRSKLDEESYEKFTCCDTCATYWAYPNKDRWNEGWRPSSEEVLNKYEVLHT